MKKRTLALVIDSGKVWGSLALVVALYASSLALLFDYIGRIM